MQMVGDNILGLFLKLAQVNSYILLAGDHINHWHKAYTILYQGALSVAYTVETNQCSFL